MTRVPYLRSSLPSFCSAGQRRSRSWIRPVQVVSQPSAGVTGSKHPALCLQEEIIIFDICQTNRFTVCFAQSHGKQRSQSDHLFFQAKHLQTKFD